MSIELIPLMVLLTTVLSGGLGMGGGLVLMGALAMVLPPAEALALHGAVQLVANGYRGFHLRTHIAAGPLLGYAAGAAVALAIMSAFAVMVEREQLFILLGLVALAGAGLGRGQTPKGPSRLWSIDSRLGALACGCIVTTSNLTAGVGGPLLDVFFLRSTLERHAVVATKAVTQTFSHVLKIGYVAALVPSALTSPAFSAPLLAASVIAALVGTRLGAVVLERLSEHGFRSATRALVGAVGFLYLLRAAL